MGLPRRRRWKPNRPYVKLVRLGRDHVAKDAASRYAGVKVEASYDVLNTHRRPACPAPTSAEPVGGGLMPSDQSAASASLKSWVLSETAGLG
jgi:hypothetical protein